MNGDGKLDESDMAASILHADKELEEAQESLELLEAREKAKGDSDDDDDDDDDEEEEGECDNIQFHRTILCSMYSVVLNCCVLIPLHV